MHIDWDEDELAGLSPRVQGRYGIGFDRESYLGSIPARAGKVMSTDASSAHGEVYPCVCGEGWV
ncbi:hypothetical protein CSQ85_11975 [Bifidobacterium rousetti]|nr:hypothetical protein CSQ85_11975 [Bifidobacterium rousetti]